MGPEEKRVPKTAVIGAHGFLGRHFIDSYRKAYDDCIGTVRVNADERNNIFLVDLTAPDIKSLSLSKRGHKEALLLDGVAKIDIC